MPPPRIICIQRLPLRPYDWLGNNETTLTRQFCESQVHCSLESIVNTVSLPYATRRTRWIRLLHGNV